MQTEITRLKAMLQDAKSAAPAAPPAPASLKLEAKEEPGGEDEDGEEHESEEEDDEEEEGDENHETPPPKDKPPAETSVAKTSNKASKGPNSSTHRAQWMKFGRRMDSQGSEFPEMTKLWSGTKEETWLSAGVGLEL